MLWCRACGKSLQEPIMAQITGKYTSLHWIAHGAITGYVKVRVMHASGMLGIAHLKGNRGLGDPAMQHHTCVTAMWDETNGMEVNGVVQCNSSSE